MVPAWALSFGTNPARDEGRKRAPFFCLPSRPSRGWRGWPLSFLSWRDSGSEPVTRYVTILSSPSVISFATTKSLESWDEYERHRCRVVPALEGSTRSASSTTPRLPRSRSVHLRHRYPGDRRGIEHPHCGAFRHRHLLPSLFARADRPSRGESLQRTGLLPA